MPNRPATLPCYGLRLGKHPIAIAEWTTISGNLLPRNHFS
ncbi:MAG: hypothetical protein QOF22_736 [Bradyrhizobium sp.]|nr:hypothetical protein [Bradyrhizobium sp.]